MFNSKPSSHAWYVAFLMMLTYAVQHIDRQIMAVILEPVKREFGLADAQLGLLSGFAFAVAYSLAVVPLGILVDRGNRRNILCLVLSIWSGLTALGSLATSYVQLVSARLLVGAAIQRRSRSSQSTFRPRAGQVRWACSFSGRGSEFLPASHSEARSWPRMAGEPLS